VFIDTCD